MIDAVLTALAGKRFRYRTETELHEGMSEAFASAGIEHEREVRIAGGRIDFVVGDLGIEVKIKGGVEPLRRQVEGYAAEPRLSGLLVVTTRPAHRLVRGAASNGKPVRVHTLGGLSL